MGRDQRGELTQIAEFEEALFEIQMGPTVTLRGPQVQPIPRHGVSIYPFASLDHPGIGIDDRGEAIVGDIAKDPGFQHMNAGKHMT